MALSEGDTCKRVRGFAAWAVTQDTRSMGELVLLWSYRADVITQQPGKDMLPGGDAAWERGVRAC